VSFDIAKVQLSEERSNVILRRLRISELFILLIRSGFAEVVEDEGDLTRGEGFGSGWHSAGTKGFGEFFVSADPIVQIAKGSTGSHSIREI